MVGPGESLFPFQATDDMTLSIIARIPIHHYSAIACTSRGMETLLSSEQLFKERYNKGIQEPLVCVCISTGDENERHAWFSLGKIPVKKTYASSAGFWLMKIRMANSYPAHSVPSMATAGSTIALIPETSYSALKLLNCETHVWSSTPPLSSFPRKMTTSSISAVKDRIYVLGGVDEKEREDSERLNVRPESYRITQGNDDGWIRLSEPGLNKNSKVVLIGSTDGNNLSFWSLCGEKSLKHTLDSNNGKWSVEPSGFLPSVFGKYSKTLFVGTTIIRLVGRLLLWFDEIASYWKEVQGRRLEQIPIHVVPASRSSIVAFSRRYGKQGSMMATEITLVKKGEEVFATQIWVDKVSDEVSINATILGSACVYL